MRASSTCIQSFIDDSVVLADSTRIKEHVVTDVTYIIFEIFVRRVRVIKGGDEYTNVSGFDEMEHEENSCRKEESVIEVSG